MSSINNEGKLYAASTHGKPDSPQKPDTPATATPPVTPSIPKPLGRGTFRRKTPIGKLLIRESLITREQLNEALVYQKAHGGRLRSCLVQLKLLTEDTLTAILSQQYGIASINLTYFEPDTEVTK